MFVSRGLVDPKANLNRDGRKGSRLIFLHLARFCSGEPDPDKPNRGSNLFKRGKPMESCNDEKWVKT